MPPVPFPEVGEVCHLASLPLRLGIALLRCSARKQVLDEIHLDGRKNSIVGVDDEKVPQAIVFL